MIDIDLLSTRDDHEAEHDEAEQEGMWDRSYAKNVSIKSALKLQNKKEKSDKNFIE